MSEREEVAAKLEGYARTSLLGFLTELDHLADTMKVHTAQATALVLSRSEHNRDVIDQHISAIQEKIDTIAGIGHELDIRSK